MRQGPFAVIANRDVVIGQFDPGRFQYLAVFERLACLARRVRRFLSSFRVLANGFIETGDARIFRRMDGAFNLIRLDVLRAGRLASFGGILRVVQIVERLFIFSVLNQIRQ